MGSRTYVVDRVLVGDVAVGVEEAEGKVAARVDGQAQGGDLVVGGGRRLGAAGRARLAGPADGELVVVVCERFEVLSLDLDRVIDVATGIDLSKWIRK